ncbi:MAG: aminotransferase class V-fold PLP-dependent enzyme [Desulfovibrio sp.]|nr:MAG: aminotransferase class V-fold PLP-dependent enzyme [Desulfovibrio sp.]
MFASQRHLFSIPDQVAYLNSATTGPLLKSAERAAQKAIQLKAEPWRITSRTFFEPLEETRALFARFLGCDADNVAFIPAVSYAMAIAARNIDVRPGDTIVVLDEQFPSHVYPWRNKALETGGKMVSVPRPLPSSQGNWTQAVLEAITKKTAIAALPHCHWTDGAALDLNAIGARCREVGAALVLDVTQSLGVMPLDLAEVQPDFLAVSAHKWMLGPYSYSYLYVADHHLHGEPLEENWFNRKGSENFARLVDYRDDYQPGARRFDVGEASNFFLTPVAKASLEQLLAWGTDNMSRHLGEITREIAARAQDMGLVAPPEHLRGPHMIGLQLPSGAPEDLPAYLAEKEVYVGVRGDKIRVAPHMHTTPQDLHRFFSALEEEL